jgi:hypothetical protein
MTRIVTLRASMTTALAMICSSAAALLVLFAPAAGQPAPIPVRVRNRRTSR